MQAKVRRLFATLMDRAPSKAELELALQYYSSSGMNLSTMTTNMLSSSELAQKYGSLTNPQFIEQIYQNALGRGATLVELEGWLGQVTAETTTRAGIADALSESSEHIADGNIPQETNDTYSTNGTWTLSHIIDTARANTIVGNLYQATLGRVADSSGLATYSGNLLNGTMTEAQIVSALASTTEFASKFGSLTTAAFVSQVFIDGLGRPPSPGEARYCGRADWHRGSYPSLGFHSRRCAKPQCRHRHRQRRWSASSVSSGHDVNAGDVWQSQNQLGQKATTATASSQPVSSNDWVTTQTYISSGYWTTDESGTYWTDASYWQTCRKHSKSKRIPTPW